MCRNRLAVARVSPVRVAMSLSVIDGWSASKAVMTESPRASDCTNWSPGGVRTSGSVMRGSIGPPDGYASPISSSTCCATRYAVLASGTPQ